MGEHRPEKFVPNDRQKQAIDHVHGPMLVVAGAGTGKTTVLAARVAALIGGGHARPDEILAVTYTDEAAAHLRSTVAEQLAARGVVADEARLKVSTFHACGFGIMQRAGRGFRVLDQQDHWIFLRRRLEQLPLKHYLPPRDPGEFLDAVLEFFSRCQDELIDPPRYAAYVAELRGGGPPLPRVLSAKKDAALPDEQKLERCEEISRVFLKVEEILAREGLGTFGHMITGSVRLLREDRAVLQREQQGARFLLIDEFQDANVAQIELAKLLAGTGANVFAVGDPDQAIYRFRGASSAAFEEFLKRFPGVRAVVLNQNQRSTSHILGCAHTVIRENPGVDCRLAPGVDFTRSPLVSAREQRARKEGKPLLPVKVEVVISDGPAAREQEAADVASEIRRLRDQGYDGSIVVLYRTHSHRKEVWRELIARQFKGGDIVVRGIDALDTPECRDLLASLAAVASLSNSEDLFRVSAMPQFAVDPERLRDELAASRRETSFASLLPKIPGGSRVMAAIEQARAFAAGVDWQAAPVCDYVIGQFGFGDTPPVKTFRKLVGDWQKKPITATGRLDELIEYVDLFRQAHGALPLAISGEPGRDAIQLMTVHSAKGLEFGRVFVLRASSGSFPVSFREHIFEFPPALREMPYSGESKTLHEEEERRLFYVAMTRAEDYLTVHARRGRGKRDASPPGYLRDLMHAADARQHWTSRAARPYTATIHAASPASGVGAWLLLPPSPRLRGRPLSATTIEAYATCPLKFKLMVEWQIPGPVSAAMTYGNIMHTVLRDFHQSIQAGRTRSAGEVLQRFEELIGEARFDDPLQARLYRQQGALQLTEYLRLCGEMSAPPIARVEAEFVVDIAGVPVRGRMDRVDRRGDGRIRIVDFKTGSPHDQEKADRSLQLTLYAMAAKAAWNETAGELAIYNLENQTEIRTVRTTAQFDEAVVTVQEVAAGVRNEMFEAREGFHCSWCEYRNVCPVKEERIDFAQATATS